MEDIRLRCERTPAGCYLYLRTPDRDILLTEQLITNEQTCDLLEQHIDQIETRLYAYRRYRATLNSVLKMGKKAGMGDDLVQMVTGVLNQFLDLDMPGGWGKI